MEEVPKEIVFRYGIIGGKKLTNTLWQVTEMIEKPDVDKSPSNLAFAGRYILTPEIFQALEETPPGKNNEVQLTDAMIRMGKAQSIYAHRIEGKRYDIGNKLDYLKTMIEFALKRKEFSKELILYMKEKLNKI